MRGAPERQMAMLTTLSPEDLIAFVLGNRLSAEVYIDAGDQTINKLLFDELAGDKEGLEAAFGEPLSWERLDHRRASRVGAYRPAPDLDNESDTSQARAWAMSRLFRLIDLFDSRLRSRMAALRSGSQALSDDISPLPG